MKIDIYILEEEDYVGEDSDGQPIYEYKYRDAMSERELRVFIGKKNFIYNRGNGTIKDSAGFEQYKVTIKTVQVF